MLIRCAGDRVATQQYAATVSCHKVRNRAAGEVAADSMERHAGQYLSLLIPDRHNWVVPLQPLPIGCLYIDRYAAESVRPFDLHTEHVWMAGRDRSKPAHLLNGSDHVIVDVPSGIPQHVAGPRAH